MTGGHVLVASKLDAAGINIGNGLIQSFGFGESDQTFDGNRSYVLGKHHLIFSNREPIDVEGLDSYFPECSSYIFLSKHRSEKGKSSLTAHFTGNFSHETKFGGKPRELSYCWPDLLSAYMQLVYSRRRDVPSYDITLEATHHGPTSLAKPVIFIELGSTENDWHDSRIGEILAACVSKLVESEPRKRKNVGICFGGTHYPERFTRLLTEGEEFSLGPIASKYSLPFVDAGIFSQMVGKCTEHPKAALLDWKSLSDFKQIVLSLCESFDLEVVKL